MCLNHMYLLLSGHLLNIYIFVKRQIHLKEITMCFLYTHTYIFLLRANGIREVISKVIFTTMHAIFLVKRKAK